MKLVVSADWHADRETLGHSRFDEIAKAVRQSRDHAIDQRADAYLFLGDLADPDNGGASYQAIGLAIETAMVLANHEIPSVWIAGNHDVFEDGSGMTTLSPLKEVSRRDARSSFIHVAEQPTFVRVGTYLDLLCFPYAPVSHAYDPEAVARTHFGMKPTTPTVVLTHLMIQGVTPGEETTEMPRGRDVVFPLAETTGAALRLAGHYHHRQTTADGIVIPGSLSRLTFSDEDHTPSFLDIEL